MKKEKLIWHTEKRKIEELKPYEGNPRKAGEKEYKDLSKSLEKFDIAEPLVINTDGTVIGGNFRLKILKDKGIKEVDVRVPSRPLTREEADELNLRLNKNLGLWDWDLLANFDEELLKEVGWTEGELNKIFGIFETIYNKNVIIPVYKSAGLNVNIDDLYDDTIFREFIKEIRKINCNKKIKKFLVYSAHRFIKFNFQNIAEFYSNLKDKKLKNIFEKLCLIIIDFNQAIERGFIEMFDNILEQIKEEYD